MYVSVRYIYGRYYAANSNAFVIKYVQYVCILEWERIHQGIGSIKVGCMYVCVFKPGW